MTAPVPAAAQSVEELDRLVVASTRPAEGLALARSQADSGALLEALSTLDRVLAAEPKSKQAKLLRASLLCRIDDRSGAGIEFARLKAKDFSKSEWSAARAPCDAATGGGR